MSREVAKSNEAFANPLSPPDYGNPVALFLACLASAGEGRGALVHNILNAEDGRYPGGVNVEKQMMKIQAFKPIST